MRFAARGASGTDRDRGRGADFRPVRRLAPAVGPGIRDGPMIIDPLADWTINMFPAP
jgi:hypothetical protein